MATRERFSISMDPAVRASVKEHADAMGLDVSSYVTAAVLRQMADDAVVARRFAATDAAVSATEALPAPEDTGPEIDFDDDELTAARAGIAEALAAEARNAA
ncbi:hypothetical protein AB0I49_29930 [Streptomyces sp. NPDC050617]|uniref:hypothetical protein n=1 Tax=Streptomyces sp. NPDC050617 TaxID=3154628 RepID=UPI00342F4C9E